MKDSEIRPSKGRCVICGQLETDASDPLFNDGAYSEFYIHAKCYNSDAAERWRESHRLEDPAYDSYLRWMVDRKPITCLSCGAPLDLSAKAIGMGADTWSVNCLACHRTSPRGLSAYGKSKKIYMAVAAVRDDFVRSLKLKSIPKQMQQIARKYDYLFVDQRCKCGGSFSLAAKCRCPYCDDIAEETYFHVVDVPLTEEQLLRLRQLFGE